jgi:hypothetical protein
MAGSSNIFLTGMPKNHTGYVWFKLAKCGLRNFFFKSLPTTNDELHHQVVAKAHMTLWER